MGKAAMKIGNFGGGGMLEQGENVRLALSQTAFAQIIEIKADPVGCPMNWMNKV